VIQGPSLYPLEPQLQLEKRKDGTGLSDPENMMAYRLVMGLADR
jgi:hypothetical protein